MTVASRCIALALACAAALPAITLTGCKPAPVAPKATPAPAPAVVLAPGYTFDPTISAAATTGFTSIHFGERLRIYARTDRWIPATITVVRTQTSGETSSRTVRIDIPPSGRITAPLLDDAGPDDTIRIAVAREGVDAERFERRIGVSEPELTADRLREINAASSTEVRAGGLALSAFSVAISSAQTALEPTYGRIVVIDGPHSSFATTTAPDPANPDPDAHWIAAFKQLQDHREPAR